MNECKKGIGGGGDFILVAKNMGGIISTYTKMTRGDSFQGGFCPYPSSFEYPNDLVSNLMSYPMSSDSHYLGLCVWVRLLYVCYLLWLAICGHNLYILVLLIPGNQTNFSVFVQVSVSHKGLTHIEFVGLSS